MNLKQFISNYYILNYILLQVFLKMYNEPSWLNIEDQLYPQTVMSKFLIIQNLSAGVPIQIQVDVIYNSYHREINITDTITNVIAEYFCKETKYRVEIFNYEEQNYQNLGNYPFEAPLFLKGSYVEIQFLRLRIEDLEKDNMFEAKSKKTDKTIKDVLKVVAQWRKIYLDQGKKITLEQAALETGVPKNTLDDYYGQIKTAQKYGFKFETNLQKPYKFLRKFVQENTSKKQKNLAPVFAILEKYHPK